MKKPAPVRAGRQDDAVATPTLKDGQPLTRHAQT
jgi:hypothetical protein